MTDASPSRRTKSPAVATRKKAAATAKKTPGRTTAAAATAAAKKKTPAAKKPAKSPAAKGGRAKKARARSSSRHVFSGAEEEENAAVASSSASRVTRRKSTAVKKAGRATTAAATAARRASRSRGASADGGAAAIRARAEVLTAQRLDALANDPRVVELRARQASLQADGSLFRNPVVLTLAFARAVLSAAGRAAGYLLARRALLFTLIGVTTACAAAHAWAADGGGGDFGAFVRASEAELVFALWWIGLGVASSIGLGSGLHTFVLYLGPRIAVAAFVAHECGSVDFDTRLPESEWECEDGPGVTMWDIVRKVMPESFLWGAGTAIGELPPYYVARAARLAGKRLEDLEDVGDTSGDGLMDRAKRRVLELMEWSGFTGILLMAAIPNPLFDLAGLTCGHLLFPFWKFFGATLIGKAIIKSQIQAVSIVALSSEAVVEGIISLAGLVSPKLSDLAHNAIAQQKAKFHHHHNQGANATGTDTGAAGAAGAGGADASGAGSMFSVAGLWDNFIKLVIGLFLISLVQSTALDHINSEIEEEIDAIMNKRDEKSDRDDGIDVVH